MMSCVRNTERTELDLNWIIILKWRKRLQTRFIWIRTGVGVQIL